MRSHPCLLFLALLATVFKLNAQPCSNLGQNPSTAIAVCGTAPFNQSTVPSCAGAQIPTTCTNGTYFDVNPFYYRFTCYTSGTLGFILDPINNADDYDWVLFDITGRNPNDIYTDISLNVAENWSATPGNTGASAVANPLRNCAGNTPNFGRMPGVLGGREYLLMVSNWSASQQGYTLTFTGGTAVITDPASPPPAIGRANVDCGGQRVNIIFNKKMRCNSLAVDRSDFVLAPANGTIAVNTGYGCLSGFEMDSVNISFNAPLPPGNYTISVASGTDGNTLLDICGNQIPVGNNISFTVPPRPALPGPSSAAVTPANDCAPIRATVLFPQPVECSSAALDGSDFVVTGPSPVTVVAVVPVCNTGQTNGFTIQFAAPITVPGTYTVTIAAGTDGNSIVGDCSRQVQVGTTTTFDVAGPTPIPMGTVTIGQCSPSSLTLTFTDPILCNSVAANASDFAITGPSAVTITGATTGTCNNGETNTIILQFASPISVPGNYQVAAMSGTDGNTLLGQCRMVQQGANSTFTLTAQATIPMGTVGTPACTPSAITLTFAEPIFCASVAANGSDFVITGPSTVAITSATANNCNANGETTSITIQLSAPIMATGNFTILVAAGTDGNPLIGQCGRQLPAGASTQFTLSPQPAIPMGTIATTTCSPTSITLNFAEPILCNSLATDGSDFAITGPAAVNITGASATCNANGETTAITIQLSAAIVVSGNFQVQMLSGSDGNTLIGNCNRRTTAGETATFTIPPAFPVPMDSLSPVSCSPSTLKLVFPSPIRCSSIAANGSDFVVTGPAVVAVASAAGSCDANGMTTTIDIQLVSPIVVGGSYQVTLVAGSDGNTLLSDCNRATTAGSTVNFITADTVSAVFQYQIQYDCETDVITFSHDGQHNVNQWTWTVNGSSGSNQQTFTQSFSASSQNQVQLVVSNGVCSDTYLTSINLNNKVTVDFDLPESACPEDTVTFTNLSTGQIDTWQWSFGNGNSSSNEAPPAQSYPTTGTETLYDVSLSISNTFGCSATITKTLKILSACIIAVPSAFTPNNDGKNDFLYPLNALKAENLDFKVFNRWGQLLFHSKDWRMRWDGRSGGVMQATGVYVWMLDYTHKDTKQKFSMKGTTTLIR